MITLDTAQGKRATSRAVRRNAARNLKLNWRKLAERDMPKMEEPMLIRLRHTEAKC
jgi:hypothetical protein